jgi:predicted PurR-regulated permease PerM
VGLLIGSLPLLLLAVADEPGAVSITLAVLVLLLQAVDSLYVRQWIGRRSLYIGLLAPWVVALLGYAVYGIGGAAYSLAVAVFVLAVLDRLHEVGDGAPGTETPEDHPSLPGQPSRSTRSATTSQSSSTMTTDASAV